MFAGILASAHTSLDHVDSDRRQLRATANPAFSYQIQESETDLRVIEKRSLLNGKGVLVFLRSGSRDSVIVDAAVLDQVSEGDILSDNSGSIER